jgi:hypothetical protein
MAARRLWRFDHTALTATISLSVYRRELPALTRLPTLKASEIEQLLRHKWHLFIQATES